AIQHALQRGCCRALAKNNPVVFCIQARSRVLLVGFAAVNVPLYRAGSQYLDPVSRSLTVNRPATEDKVTDATAVHTDRVGCSVAVGGGSPPNALGYRAVDQLDPVFRRVSGPTGEINILGYQPPVHPSGPGAGLKSDLVAFSSTIQSNTTDRFAGDLA